MLRTFALSCLTALAVALTAIPTANAQPVITSGADSLIINGWWDTNDTVAHAPGQMTAEISGVFSGIPVAQLDSLDTLIVDSCYAFSSLESLAVDSVGASAYDTVFFLYYIQNQGNVTDSFEYRITLVDTGAAGSFLPTNFDLWAPDSTTPFAGVDSVSDDTLVVGVALAQDALDSLLIRVVIPSPLTAENEDTLRIGVEVRDHLRTGAWDAWPDTIGTYHTSRRTIRDTLGFGNGGWLHTRTTDSTMLDFGDTQYDTVFIAIAAPIIRLSKSVTKASAKVKPGDTLTYTIVYDNDGSAETRDMLNIVDVFPGGIMYLGIDSLSLDTTARAGVDTIDVDYRIGSAGAWQDGEPATAEARLRVTGLRFRVPEGVGAQYGTDNAGATVADDSIDSDAGFVRFKVLVR